MNKQLRKAVIAGNWKMNKTPSETTQLIEEIKPLVANASCDVVVCVPYIDLHAALEATKGSNISVGAENCHWEQSGAFTGEISASMLSAIGVNYVIIGHSERRTYFGETDVTVNQRVRAALNEGLTVILCVGEYLEQREQGITAELVAMQVKIALSGVSKEELKRFSDCTHSNEPKCAVQDAISTGLLSRERFESYLKLKKEARYDGLNSRQIENEKLNEICKEFGGMKSARKMLKAKSKSRRRF